MNKIFNDVLESRKGMYCHALELNSAYDLGSVIEEFLSQEGDKYTCEEYIEFFSSMSLYYVPYDGEEEIEEDEEELYNVNISDLVVDCYEGAF